MAYTPGKKKIETVEVFYLMPKSVPDPFVGGPHRTRLWHGRAGWCATMRVASAGASGDAEALVRRRLAEKVWSGSLLSGLRVEDAVRQSCCLLRTLVRDSVVSGAEVLSCRGFACAVRRVCEYGVFSIDGDSQDREERALVLFDSWLPLVERPRRA